MPAQTVIQVRRDTATNWSSTNPTLAAGEIGYDSTNKLFKMGDGSTAWNSLGTMGTQGAEKAYAQSATATTVVNTTTATSLMTVSISGAIASDVYQFSAWGTRLNNTGAAVNYTVRLNLGGTTYLQSAAYSLATSANRGRWELNGNLYVISTTTQELNASVLGTGTGSADTFQNFTGNASYIGNAAPTIDLSTAKDLTFTVQMGTASANADMVCEGFVVTRLR